MQIDGYAFCACGSGKKIKFCCCKDLLRDLEKVLRSLSGEQFTATQTLLTQLIADRGPRPALLALLAETHVVQEQLPEARKIAEQLLEIMPHSGAAHVVTAICDAAEGKVDSAVEHLQQVLESLEPAAIPNLENALMMVAHSLMHDGRLQAARGHFLLAAGLTTPPVEDALKVLEKLNRSPQIPIPLKQDFVLSHCPAGVRWHGEFDAALHSANRGAWLAASESLESLNDKVPGQLAILRNIAILRSWLGHADAVDAWRQLESIPAVAEDEAVELESLAQLLKLPPEREMSDVVQLTFGIQEMDRLLEGLLSEKRCHALEGDLRDAVPEGQPPPRAMFQLLDRPIPVASETLKLADLPRVLGVVVVFGKQTDREARLEFGVELIDQLETAQQSLWQIAGSWLKPSPTREVVAQLPIMELVMRSNYWLPRDLSVERLTEFQRQIQEQTYTTVWPDVPQQVLNGKTARQAVLDPQLRIRVQAEILNYELMTDHLSKKVAFDFDRLRQHLGLPGRGAPCVPGQDFDSVPLARWSRVDFSTLSDDQLMDALSLVLMKHLRSAIRNAVQVVINRPSVSDRVDLAEMYRVMAVMSADTDEALRNIELGRRITETKGESPAQWHLLELQVRLARMEAEESNRLTRLLATQYRNEPGVSEGLYQILANAGVIGPDGKVRQVPSAGPASEPAPPEKAAEPAGLWTPDSPGTKQESKLWLPGMQ